MLYRLSVYAFTENIWQRFLIRKIAAKSHDKVFLDDKNLDLLIGFSPRLREHGLNPDNIKVREGLRITLNRLHAMHTFCKEYGISFMVVLLPTKEKVYEPVINKHPDINFFSVFQRVFTFEDSIKHTIIKDLKKDSIHYIDVLPPLQNAIKKQQIYPITRDGHPNKNGCQIIAASAAKYCSKQFKEFQ